MVWSILLIKKNDNGWFINYIEKKLKNQILELKLQDQIEIVIFEPKVVFTGRYVNIIEEDTELSDNYIKVLYDKMVYSTADCIGIQGLIFKENKPYVFKNINTIDTIKLPITKSNPIKRNLIFNLKNIIYYISSENLTKYIKSIDNINEIVLFKNNKVVTEPISIIITAYESELYIEECLDSIEKQSYFINNDNFEVLVGVDGCKKTLDKLNTIKHKYRNLSVYMMESNKGTYVTTNTLIDLVTNENVIRFDSDDVMLPNLVHEVLKNKKGDDIVMLGSLEMQNGVTNNNFLMTEGIIYFKKSLMDNIAGGYMPWLCSADTELIRRVVKKAKISQLKKALFYRRIHSNSLTQKKSTGYKSNIRKRYKEQMNKIYNDNDIKINRVTNNHTITENNKLKSIINRTPNNNPFEAVKVFVLEKFGENEKYINSIIVLGYNFNFNIDDIKLKNPNKKIIIYQLEQLYNNRSQWYNPNSTNKTVISRTEHINYVLSKCDEIWDYDLDNIKFIKKQINVNNIIHVPLGFSSNLIKKKDIIFPKYDIIFYGSLNDIRIDKLKKIYKKYKNILIICPDYDLKKYSNEVFSDVMISSVYNDKLFEYIFNSKIVLNLHYYDSKIQEQVRIFELIINNCTIVSERSRINYFGDLIYNFDNDDEMINIIDNILKNNLWKNSKNSKKFKDMTKYKVGAVYNTFYGLDQIEKSINSIKNVVDYFILVHQHNSIDNKTSESEINKIILERLKNSNLNIDIIYHEPKMDMMGINNIGYKHRYILEKRNIGLDYCKRNNCDFLIPLDTDERYSSDELKKEIDYMYDNDIETLYSPILSYYYDEEHYFLDTYHVPSVYKINDRIFEKTKTSVLTDPVRKMKERTFKVSNMHMHHYTYMYGTYKEKMESGLRTSNPNIKTQVEKIGEHLLYKWKEDDDALVFLNDLNDGGNTILSYIKLKKIK